MREKEQAPYSWKQRPGPCSVYPSPEGMRETLAWIKIREKIAQSPRCSPSKRMAETIVYVLSWQPHYSSGDPEESRSGVLVSRKLPQCPKENQLIGPPQLLIPRVPQMFLGSGLVWGSLGTFSPICFQNPTPGAYALESCLFSTVVLYKQTWSQGQLGCLRAIPLEMPLLSTIITSSSLSPLGIFPQAVSEQV